MRTVFDKHFLRPGCSMKAAVVGVAFVALVAVCTVLIVKSLRHPSQGGDQGGALTRDPKALPSDQAVEAGLDAAATYQRQGQFAQAAAVLSKMAEQAPQDQRIRLAWAQGLLGLKDYSKAYEQYQAAIAIEQGSAPGAVAMTNNPKMAQLQGEAGTCALMAGQVDRAAEHFSMAQTADATNARYPLYLAMAQLKLGGEENDAAAMANLVRVTVLDPSSAEAWGTLAEIEIKKNRLDLAAQHLEKAISIQPNQPKWRMAQARIENRRGKPELAIAQLTNLDEATRYSKPVLQLLSESYGLLSRPADAAVQYEQAAAKSPTDAELWYQAAIWYQRAGEAAKAKKAAATAAMLGHEPAKELAQTLK